jgi:hypothetical protein
MEDKKKNFLEKRDQLVSKLKVILAHLENNETSLNGSERKIVMDMFKEVNESLLKEFDQASLELFSSTLSPEDIAAEKAKMQGL